ncbi:hypothetical protein PYW08_010487 [Mythimna loreyi]|uniref:Uncharacterized protein n=1 Tax=Mythimna loreyi TaxID=667449 RepID=A0ACC2Q4X2_9NEOP|nr:hypothetical protein PYW08_010487 [Mythimna loreyi]
MPRSTVPSRVQVDMLLECLEERPWLATGHARTSHARDRVRAAWREIAIQLNSDENGCIKSWQQWSKYWKDKKSAVKKKASQIRTGIQTTGVDGEEEGLVLSTVEERMVALMVGRRLVTDRKKPNIVPIEQNSNQQTPPSENDSQLASLAERFIAVEEKRLENDRLVMQNQQKMLEIFLATSEAWTRQAQAIQELCAAIKRES